MKLQITPTIKAFIDALPLSILEDSLEFMGSDWIEHEALVKLYCAEKARNSECMALNDILKSTGVYIEPPSPIPPKTPEYIALMKRLEREQQEREYKELLQQRPEGGALYGPDNRVMDSLNNRELKAAKEQVSTIVNVLVSAVAVAWATWIWTSSWAMTSRALACILTSLVTLIAEVVLYWGYKNKIRLAREREAAIRESHEAEIDAAASAPAVANSKPEDALAEENTPLTTHSGDIKRTETPTVVQASESQMSESKSGTQSSSAQVPKARRRKA